MERHNNTAWKYTFIYLSGLPMLMEAQLNTWGLFNHRQITAFTQNVTHQKFPFLCFANLFCVLQLFRSIEKPEGAHGPREWVSPQGAASKKCHTCKPTERPREHRQACLQHEQNRGGHIRGWWWVSIFLLKIFSRSDSIPSPQWIFFSTLMCLWWGMEKKVEIPVLICCICGDFCLQIAANISLIQPQSLWIKPTTQRPKWPPATGMALSTGMSPCWVSVPPNKATT